MQAIVIITTKQLWGNARHSGEYTKSTLESSLDEVGFIHCTSPEQTVMIANRHFTRYDDLILLLIDSEKVISEVKYEESLSGRGGVYPHIYGPLNTDAVYKIIPLPKDAQGKFTSPPELQ